MKKYSIDISFIIVFICFIFSKYQQLYFKLLLIIFIHELGHLFFIFLFKVEIKKLKLYALGFILKLEECNIFYKDLLISLGGIIFNILIIPFINNDLLYLNYFILLFNLLPISPLDGKNTLNIVLAKFIPFYKSLILAAIISLIFLVCLTIFVTFFLDYLVLFNIIYLWIILFNNIFNIKYIYESFLLKRCFNKDLFSKKYIKFNHNLIYKFYKYKNIYTYFNNKTIYEADILEYHYKNKIWQNLYFSYNI